MTITFFIPTKYQNRQAVERDLCSDCVIETLAWIDRGVS